MILYFKHIIHIDDFPLNRHRPSATLNNQSSASIAQAYINTPEYNFIIPEWTTSLDTSSSTLFVCRGGEDCVQRDLSPTSGYTGISARRRYQFWERDLSPTFKRINDRICAASINLVNHKLIVISAYAPTLEVREANPELRELFYNQLDSTVSRDS